jgi:hypothetical protein
MRGPFNRSLGTHSPGSSRQDASHRRARPGRAHRIAGLVRQPWGLGANLRGPALLLAKTMLHLRKRGEAPSFFSGLVPAVQGLMTAGCAQVSRCRRGCPQRPLGFGQDQRLSPLSATGKLTHSSRVRAS